MIKMFLYTVFFIVLSVNFSFSQKKISLKLSERSDSLLYNFYNIQPKKIDRKVILPDIDIKEYTLSRSIDLKSISKTLPILLATTLSNNKIIVFDSNLNYNFSDDEIITFSDTLNSVAQRNVKHYDNFIFSEKNKFHIEFDYSIIKPTILHLNYGDTLENKFHLFVKPFQYRVTKLPINDTTYFAYLFSKHIFNFERNSSFIAFSKDSTVARDIITNPSKYEKFSIGDYMSIGQKHFSFDSVSNNGNSLYINVIDKERKLYGNKKDFYLNEFSSNDIVTDNLISNYNFLGKYLIIDLWGTWCGPCLQILEDLKSMHSTLDSQKFSTLGVCFDKDKGIVKQFIKKHNIIWPQLFDLSSKGEIITLLDVKEFPSFILVNPEGKVIYRDNGISGFFRMKDVIDNIK